MKQWTKEQEIALINQTQDEYVQELIDILNSNNPSVRALEEVNFTSPTGTGKTKMMAKIINRMPNDYFIVTTLSKGQLHKQISKAIEADCTGQNFRVYGVQSYTKNSILQDDDILAEIQNLPENARVFWFRDEGHIKSNKWMQLLQKSCDKIVNWSATNHDAFGVKCNFMHTMMLRIVQQIPGDIDMALDKLLEVKQQHKEITGYNPCAIVRLTSTALLETVAKACTKRKLSYISLLQNDDYDMSELCEDDCEYDVIINQQKIVEGIDVRRAHVLWMENEPVKAATTIQMIGRCRRNALLWRDDIDICAPENKELLKETRQCFAFYNEKNMKIAEDETGELAQEFCPIISVERLKCGSVIHVIDGVMSNGLSIEELQGCTGEYLIEKDPTTGFNIVNNPEFYKEHIMITNLKWDDIEPIEWIETINNYVLRYPEWIHQAKQTIATYLKNDAFWCTTYKYCHTELRIYTKLLELNTKGMFTEHSKKYTGSDATVMKVLQTQSEYQQCTPFDATRQQIGIKTKRGRLCLYYEELQTLLTKRALQLTDLNPSRFVRPPGFTYHAGRWIWYEQPEPYLMVVNNNVLAQIGPDIWRAYKQSNVHTKNNADELNSWVPDTAITKRIQTYSKLGVFIRNSFNTEYQKACQSCFDSHKRMNFPGKANRIFGVMVEYMAKCKIYGVDFLEPYYSVEVEKEAKKCPQPCPELMMQIRACMIKYREDMKAAHHMRTNRFVPGISLEALLNEQYNDFIRAIDKYSTIAADFLAQYQTDNTLNHAISTTYCTGLVDAMSRKTIVDIKCTGNITATMILQVLTYGYFMRTTRLLPIERAVIYDALSGRHIEIPMPNIETNPCAEKYEQQLHLMIQLAHACGETQ